MSSVIVEADRKRSGATGFSTLFDQNDGATHLWMMGMVLPAELRIGLHYHGGDEIWRVRSGRIRLTVGDESLECSAGQLVVVPPHVSHGVLVLDGDVEVEVIGELGMGEWIRVVDADGSTRDVEVHVPTVPWHRPPPEGRPPTTPEEMMALHQITSPPL
jgi:mannose-6-phosphate isomerase-like protein (cupin superfamily)